jgi:hypothetical protein
LPEHLLAAAADFLLSFFGGSIDFCRGHSMTWIAMSSKKLEEHLLDLSDAGRLVRGRCFLEDLERGCGFKCGTIIF